MYFGVLIFLVFMIGLIIYSAFDTNDVSVFEFRKTQSKSMSQENAIRSRMKEYTEKKVDYSKRYKIETLCMNAGFTDMTYADYLMLSLGSSLLFFFIFGVLLGNIVLGLFLAFVGYSLPKQVLNFIKNKRAVVLEQQIGPFMEMVIKRYENTSDFDKSLILTMEEFRGTEPMYGELRKTVSEIKVGVPTGEAMDNLARRTGNMYLSRLSDYYKIAYRLGTQEVREKLLTQAYLQFEENRRMKDFLKKEISEPVRDAYVMVATIPVFALFGVFTMDDYLAFMLFDPIGKIGLAVIVFVMIASVWFINTKIAAPLD